jgi:hypothetical protein
MHPANWDPGEQPNYPRQWDIDWLEKKIVRELKCLPVNNYPAVLAKLTGQDLVLLAEMGPTDASAFRTYCLFKAAKERGQ